MRFTKRQLNQKIKPSIPHLKRKNINYVKKGEELPKIKNITENKSNSFDLNSNNHCELDNNNLKSVNKIYRAQNIFESLRNNNSREKLGSMKIHSISHMKPRRKCCIDLNKTKDNTKIFLLPLEYFVNSKIKK